VTLSTGGWEGLASLVRQAGAFVEVRHTGNSMVPCLPTECLLRIRCGDPEWGPGSVLAVRVPDGIVTHRAMHRGRSRRSRDYVITRGDAAWLPDRPFQESMVLGVVTAVKVDGRWADLDDAVPVPRRPMFASLTFGALRVALEMHPWIADGLHRFLYAGVQLARRLRGTAGSTGPST